MICAYLDSPTQAPALLVRGTAHICPLRRPALIDCLLDAAVAVRTGRRARNGRATRRGWSARPARRAGHWRRSQAKPPPWPRRTWPGPPRPSREYLDFRLPDLGWRSAHPALATWLAGVGERPSLKQTRPPR